MLHLLVDSAILQIIIFTCKKHSFCLDIMRKSVPLPPLIKKQTEQKMYLSTIIISLLSVILINVVVVPSRT